MGDDEAIELDAVEQRVVGSLLEKERTVPASYPMTLNGLRTACNQTSGRDPVMDVDDRELHDAIDRLKARGLARLVHASHGARVVKYRQVLDERLDLDDGERAVVTLLLLRGAQTPGELRSRAERLHAFAGLGEVEAALGSLARRSPALVRELPRAPGQKEARWVHRLGPVPDPPAASAPAGPRPVSTTPSVSATEAVLADGGSRRDERVRAAYDAVAGAYADHLGRELDGKPFDRWLLERVAELAEGGPVADVGCGPGHVALHLAAAGAEVTGFDLSPAMVAEARRRQPDLRFEVADLRSLPAPEPPAAGWSAVAAWYSLVHLATSELAGAVAALARTLAPGGVLALALHTGDEVRHLSEWWDRAVDVDFTLHRADAVRAAVTGAGLVDVEWYLRSPNPAVEVETERLYVLARRPAAEGGGS
jgi:uncharacterized protein YceH (UPF0502 family)/SAM-dependent methyltransferase